MKIALVGNQNSGKTSLFNVLTGATQKVGNWPGVTLEKKTGIIRKTGDELIDLPGIYSLSPYSLEEGVSREYLLQEKPELVINIIDSTTLERSLYLTTQLLELDVDVVVALNMMDIIKKQGIILDVEKLSQLLGVTVVPISARKKDGINQLIEIVREKTYLKKETKTLDFYPGDVKALLTSIQKEGFEKAQCSEFESVKIFERDIQFTTQSGQYEVEIKKIEEKHKMDAEELIAESRYGFIDQVCLAVITKLAVKKETFSSKVDKVLLNKWAFFPIFILIMGLVYFIAVGLMGTVPLDFVDALFSGSEELSFSFGFIGIENPEWIIPFNFEGLGPMAIRGLLEAGAAPWAAHLVGDGMIGGVGSILTFTPQLAVLFFFLGILESTGYMSRVAFALDRVFRRFSLNGQSIIPFIVSTGCAVPGIMASKTIEDQNERKITAITTSFMPCGAKIPIIATIVGAFFGSFGWLITLGLYIFAIVIILAVAIFLKKVVYKVKDDQSSYISELPTYKAPMMGYVFRDTGLRLWDFVKKAGTIILVSAVVIWVLSNFNWAFQYLEEGEIGQSMLAGIGHGLSWLFIPMMSSSMVFGGAGYTDLWSITVSAAQGLIAKENVVVAMEIIAGGEEIFAAGGAFGFMNGWTGAAFMVFNLFSSPCFAALGAMKRELNSPKEFWTAFGIQMGIAWVLATTIGLVGLGVEGIVHAFA